MTTAEQSDKRRIHTFIDAEVVKRAKIQAVKEGITLTELIEKALDEYCSKRESCR